MGCAPSPSVRAAPHFLQKLALSMNCLPQVGHCTEDLAFLRPDVLFGPSFNLNRFVPPEQRAATCSAGSLVRDIGRRAVGNSKALLYDSANWLLIMPQQREL